MVKTASKTLGPKESAEVATRYLKELIPLAEQILVEEVYRAGRGGAWQVTLSYLASIDIDSLLCRQCKVLRVDAKSGEVLSMRILRK